MQSQKHAKIKRVIIKVMHPVIIVQIFNYVKMYHHDYKLPLFLIGTLVRSKFIGPPTGGYCEHSGRTFEFRSNMI